MLSLLPIFCVKKQMCRKSTTVQSFLPILLKRNKYLERKDLCSLLYPFLFLLKDINV